MLRPHANGRRPPCLRRGGHFEIFIFSHYVCFIAYWVLWILHAPDRRGLGRAALIT